MESEAATNRWQSGICGLAYLLPFELDDGATKLAKEIREAQDWRVDLIVQVVTALTGIIGAMAR